MYFQANEFYNKYNGGPRLRVPGALCTECVTMLNRADHEKNQIEQDANLIKDMSKPSSMRGDSSAKFWVGKMSSRKWKKLAKANVENNLSDMLGVDAGQESDNEDGDEAKNDALSASDMEDGDDEACSSQSTTKSPKLDEGVTNGEQETSKASAEQSQPPKPDMKFNEDLLCEHNNLCEDIKKRKLVHHAVWGILRGYFPTSPEFRETDPVCQICKVSKQLCGIQQLVSLSRAPVGCCRAEPEREGRQRPARVAVEERHTIHDEHGCQCSEIPPVSEQGKPPYNALPRHQNFPQGSQQLHQEPSATHQAYHDQQLCVDLRPRPAQSRCRSLPRRLHAQSRRQRPEWRKLCETFHNTGELRLYTDHLDMQDSLNVDICVECTLKRYNDIRYSYIEQAITGTTVVNSSSSRRAASSSAPIRRRRKLKGDTEIRMSAHETIKEIKLKIQEANGFTFGASDLHLWVDNTPLSDDMATLRDLEITPDTVITMKVRVCSIDFLVQEEDKMVGISYCNLPYNTPVTAFLIIRNQVDYFLFAHRLDDNFDVDIIKFVDAVKYI
ncbi:hypothetical protein B566_EDAN013547 [Ephemera danica]|nr:hypothetical protein B566_EDAN013547 [Ephemera danica]